MVQSLELRTPLLQTSQMISGCHQKLSYVRAFIKHVKNDKLENFVMFFLFSRCASHMVLALI